MAFKCGGTEVSVTGSVVARVTAIDKMSASFVLTFTGKKGIQVPQGLEGAPSDAPTLVTSNVEEPVALTMKGSTNNEELVEIKALY
jgi:hypothetical protein